MYQESRLKSLLCRNGFTMSPARVRGLGSERRWSDNPMREEQAGGGCGAMGRGGVGADGGWIRRM